MEMLIVLVVVTVLLVIMGVSAEMLIVGFLGLLCLMMVALVLFFIYCIIRMTKCRKCSGKLSEVTKNPKHGFSVPVYDIDGEKYENVFPCEIVMKKQLYYEGRECRLLLDEKRRKVFDGNARASSIVGIVISAVSAVLLIFNLISML